MALFSSEKLSGKAKILAVLLGVGAAVAYFYFPPLLLTAVTNGLSNLLVYVLPTVITSAAPWIATGVVYAGIASFFASVAAGILKVVNLFTGVFSARSDSQPKAFAQAEPSLAQAKKSKKPANDYSHLNNLTDAEFNKRFAEAATSAPLFKSERAERTPVESLNDADVDSLVGIATQQVH